MVIQMIKWIQQEVLRTLKTKKSFLLFIVVVISMITFNANYEVSKKEPEDDLRYMLEYESIMEYDRYDIVRNALLYRDTFSSYCTFKESDITLPSYVNCDDYEIFSNHLDEFSKLENINDIYEYKLFLLDIATDNFFDYFDRQSLELQESIKKKAVRIEDIRAYKKVIKDKYYKDRELFEYDIPFGGDITAYNVAAIDLYETFIMLENNYPANVVEIMTGSFYIATYLSENFLLLLMISILIIYDTFHRDLKSGVYKTILSAPTRRFRYIIVKTISSIISISLIVFVPLLIMVVILKVSIGFDTDQYTVYISRTTLNSFNPALQYSNVITEYKNPDFYSTYKQFCTIGPITKFPVDIKAAAFNQVFDCTSLLPALNVTFLTLAEYNILLLAYLLLMIVFMSSLNTLFSMVFSSPIINASIMGLILIVSVFINQLFIGSSVLKLLPFTFINPTSLLLGTVPYTYCNGVITLSIWIVVLVIVNYIIVKHKDFTY